MCDGPQTSRRSMPVREHLPGCARSCARSRYSIGVRCTALPPRVTLRLARSTATSPNSTIGELTGAAHAATQHRADACQQLGDAKGLREVVVGAGVERLHLVASSVRADSTMIGSVDNARSSRMKSTPSPIGQPEVEDREVGLARAGIDDAALRPSRLRSRDSLRPRAPRGRSGGSRGRPRRSAPAVHYRRPWLRARSVAAVVPRPAA